MNLERFKLKNFSTTIQSEKSIMEIELMLANIGASAIMKEFHGDGRIKSISFKIDDKGYKIPANSEGVYQVMFGNKRVSHLHDAMKNRRTDAENVAWRLIKDWLHAQLSLMASGQVQPDEVMLPFMFDGKRTLYEAYKTGGLQIENKEGGE